MRVFPIACVLALVGFVHTASAAPKSQRAKVDRSASAKCESRGDSIRRCLVEGSAAELELLISPNGGQIFMTLEEPPTMAIEDRYVKVHSTEKSVLFTLKDNNRLPKNHKMIVTTESMTLTIRFRVVSSGSDSQVQIVRADKAARDQAVDARVAAIRAELEKKHRSALNKLDAKAARLARQQVLDALHDGGGRIGPPGGELRKRNDFLVLRAVTSIRIGGEYYLKVSIQERKGDTFSIDEFKGQIRQGTVKRSIEPAFRCGSMRVRPGKTVYCYVALGKFNERLGYPKLDLLVTGEAGERSVRIEDVRLR